MFELNKYVCLLIIKGSVVPWNTAYEETRVLPPPPDEAGGASPTRTHTYKKSKNGEKRKSLPPLPPDVPESVESLTTPTRVPTYKNFTKDEQRLSRSQRQSFSIYPPLDENMIPLPTDENAFLNPGHTYENAIVSPYTW